VSAGTVTGDGAGIDCERTCDAHPAFEVTGGEPPGAIALRDLKGQIDSCRPPHGVPQQPLRTRFIAVAGEHMDGHGKGHWIGDAERCPL
jgi:hypothetical protein